MYYICTGILHISQTCFFFELWPNLKSSPSSRKRLISRRSCFSRSTRSYSRFEKTENKTSTRSFVSSFRDRKVCAFCSADGSDASFCFCLFFGHDKHQCVSVSRRHGSLILTFLRQTPTPTHTHIHTHIHKLRAHS